MDALRRMHTPVHLVTSPCESLGHHGSDALSLQATGNSRAREGYPKGDPEQSGFRA